jgi:hypothetical protein
VSASNFYLLTFLPGIDDLGDAPALAPTEFLRMLEDSSARPLAEMVFLADDLLQRDAWSAGEFDEDESPTPAVLSTFQIRGEEPLPEWLAPAGETNRPVAGDDVWEAYYREAARVAARRRSAFLAEWVRFEVTLRNELAEARARALEIDATPYLLAEELREDDQLGNVIGEWAGAANPLEGLRVLDSARWEWLITHEPYFSFADDELTAYAAKLSLVKRWERLRTQLEQLQHAEG